MHHETRYYSRKYGPRFYEPRRVVRRKIIRLERYLGRVCTELLVPAVPKPSPPPRRPSLVSDVSANYGYAQLRLHGIVQHEDELSLGEMKRRLRACLRFLDRFLTEYVDAA